MERLSIDEAIANERAKAEMRRFRIINRLMTMLEIEECEREMDEHEQLAEWLEELKSYRASVFSGDMTQKMLKEEYNKAIDDLLYKMLEKGIIDLYQYNEMRYFAEQLKAGESE